MNNKLYSGGIFLKTIYINEKEDLTKRKAKRIIKKIYKISKREDIVIALSKNLENHIELNKMIEEYGFKILDGRWLFKFLLYDILEYISEVHNKRIEMQNVAILMNNMDEIIMQQLSEIAKKVKGLKIVTNDINKYTYIEEKLYYEYGIAIQITNNKSKSLTNTYIIINFDFGEEEFNKCNIDINATIININKEIKLYLDNFRGQNINKYEIEFDEENFCELTDIKDFDRNVLYESYIYRKDNFENIRKQLKKDNVKLVKLK